MIAAGVQQQPTIKITWHENRPSIETARLFLKPIKNVDLSFYQALFQNATAMAQYSGNIRTPEQTANRFKIWLDRWNQHSFSALKITDKATGANIGHVILGHGDFDEDIDRGWSEMAIVVDPSFWNANFVDTSKGIGTRHMHRIGTETVQAIVAYAKELFKRKALVPVDVTNEQRLSVDTMFGMGFIQKCLNNSKDQIETIFIPFKSVRATCLRTNVAAHRIFQNVFVQQNGGTCTPSKSDLARDLFEIKL